MYEMRIKHLEEVHRAVDKQVETLEKTGKFDDAQLSKLKKYKLTLKDKIAILKRKQQGVISKNTQNEIAY